MRPKYILWILVAAVSALWYVLDPQAHLFDPEGRAVDPIPNWTIAATGGDAVPGFERPFDRQTQTPEVEALAEAIAGRGVKAMDALHVASAIESGPTWRLTTDLKLIRKLHGDDRIVGRLAEQARSLRARVATPD